jgi:hypothetical protein
MITAKEIASIAREGDDFEEAERLKAEFAKLRRERQPLHLTSTEFDQVLRWKLIQQYGRVRHLFVSNTEEIIRDVTGLALTISHSDKEYELELRMNILCSLRGVGVPIASAILALVFPEEYAVVDFRVWRQLFDKPTEFSISDYKRYMNKIRPLAKELGWLVQEVDYAIWEYDKRNNK